MRFALVDPKTLKTTIVEVGPRAALAVPLASGVQGSIDSGSLEHLVHATFKPEAETRHAKVLSRRNAILRKRGLTERHGFDLGPPPPWLLSIAVVMWQGILQGATWGAVKAAARRCLGTLRADGSAPVGGRGRRATAVVEFGWLDFASSERRLRKLYLQLRMVHGDDGALYPTRIRRMGHEPSRELLNERTREKASIVFPLARPGKAKPKPKRKVRRARREATRN